MSLGTIASMDDVFVSVMVRLPPELENVASAESGPLLPPKVTSSANATCAANRTTTALRTPHAVLITTSPSQFRCPHPAQASWVAGNFEYTTLPIWVSQHFFDSFFNFTRGFMGSDHLNHG